MEAGVDTRAALRLAGYPKSSWYRHRATPPGRPAPILQSARYQPAALTEEERAQIRAHLSDEAHVKLSVQQVFYQVMDQGTYIASLRTWHRVAAAAALSGDRRRQATHPPRTIPELVAHAPNQVWSWDITRIPIRSQRTSLHLYLMLDVFSRKPVGWRLEHLERDHLANQMILQAITTEGTTPHTLHADGGPSMTSRLVKETLTANGIEHSRSRPHVSNDNPFSEALFKTLKYDLDYHRFNDYDTANTWIADFIDNYTHNHRHSGLNGYTPQQVHNGTWTHTAQHRQKLLTQHHHQHPTRYRTPPTAKTPPQTTYINPPQPSTVSHAA